MQCPSDFCFGVCWRPVRLEDGYDDLDVQLEPHNTTQYSVSAPLSTQRRAPPQHQRSRQFWNSVAGLFHRPGNVRLTDDLSEARPFFTPKTIDFADNDDDALDYNDEELALINKRIIDLTGEVEKEEEKAKEDSSSVGSSLVLKEGSIKSVMDYSLNNESEYNTPLNGQSYIEASTEDVQELQKDSQ